MARNTSFRSKCSELVSLRQSNAMASTIYILRETGPTGFLLKEEGEAKKFKVLLGDPHTCTCPSFVKDRELCSHICWVLLRKFRVSPDNPISWQQGLVEREISELLRGLHDFQRRQREHQRKQLKKLNDSLRSDGAKGRPVIEQRHIEEDDVCAICQEELLLKKLPLTYCKYGCGNSIHIKCMKVWAEHQRRSSIGQEGKDEVKCPFCREDFGSLAALLKEYRTAQDKFIERTRDKFRHQGTKCHGCDAMPIVGKCYRCENCPSYHLCNPCFSKGIHRHHRFAWRQKTNQVWHPAERPSGSALPEAIVRSLMNRTLTSADYDLLSQLDSVAHDASDSPIDADPTCPDYIVASIPTEVVSDDSPLLELGNECAVCSYRYRRYERVKILPGCKHKFHIECIDRWLLHSRATCPIDGSPVTDPTRNRRRRPRSRNNQNRGRDGPANSTGGNEAKQWQPQQSLVDEGGFVLFGNKIRPSDLSPERSPFSPITSVQLRNALHVGELPPSDPISQVLRRMPENVAVTSREVMGRQKEGNGGSKRQQALFQFPMPRERRKKTVIHVEGTPTTPRLPMLQASEGVIAAKPILHPKASIPHKNRKRTTDEGLMPLISRLSSVDSEARGHALSSSVSSRESAGRDSPNGTAVDRRRAVSQGSIQRGTCLRDAESTTGAMGPKSRSMNAVAERGTVSKTRAEVMPKQESLSIRGVPTRENLGGGGKDEDVSPLFPEPTRLSIGLAAGQLANFSRGLLMSTSNTPLTVGTSAERAFGGGDHISYGRRIGQAKRLAQPGRLMALHRGEPTSEEVPSQPTSSGAEDTTGAIEFNVVALTSPLSTLTEARLTNQLQ